MSVERGSVSRDNLYLELEGLLCSEGEVCMTQGPLRSRGKWAGGGGRRRCLTLAGGTSPWGSAILLISSIWRNISARKDDPAVQRGPNKCTRHWEKQLAIAVLHHNFLPPVLFFFALVCTTVWSPNWLGVSLFFYKDEYLCRYLNVLSNCLTMYF